MTLVLPIRKGREPEPPPLSPYTSPMIDAAIVAVNRLYHHATHKPLAPASDADFLRTNALVALEAVRKENAEMRRVYTDTVRKP